MPEPTIRGSGLRALTDPDYRRELIELYGGRRWVAQTRELDSKPGVSVIIPTYQGRDRIQPALQSLAAQDVDRELLEIVVVSNGADDGTIALLRDFVANHRDITTRVLSTPTPSAGNARNIGLAAASRDYVTFLDDDDTIEPRFLCSLLDKAASHRIVTTRLTDVFPDGSVDRSSALSARLVAIENLPGGAPLGRVPGVLGFNACKLIPRHVAVRYLYDPSLRSGEDVAYMANLLAESLTVVSAEGVDRDYLRAVRPGSVSRRDTDLDFSVLERLNVIRRVSTVNALPNNRPGIDQLIRGQAQFIGRYLAANPGEQSRVRDEIDKAQIDSFPWNVVNGLSARDLAFLYCFAPFNDPSGVVAAKVLADRGRPVDVVAANMSKVRERDPSIESLAKEWLGRRATIATTPAFSSWEWISDWATKALEIAHKWMDARDEPYERLYTRALWVGSHVAGALYKAQHPDIRWSAEFSDPLGRGIDAQRREGELIENSVTVTLRSELARRGVVVPENASLFEFVELVTYVLADELIFTNENQRDYMLSLFSEAVTARALKKSTIRPHPAPQPSAYSAVECTYLLAEDVVNVGYFGSFYGSRTLSEVVDGLAELDVSTRDRLRLHVFCNRPEDFEQLLHERGLARWVQVNPYLNYMEFLNATTKLDVLVVQDAVTSTTFAANPFLPSKYSDYRGSGSAIWGIIEPGSPLSTRPLDYVSIAGDRAGAAQVLRSLAGN